MKSRLIKIFLLLTITMQAQAGSGAGGIIEVENKTNETLDVIWGGLGCFDIRGGFTLVCDRGVIEAGRKRTYKYDWGITRTWLNLGLGHGEGQHSCFNRNNNCIARGGTVSTTGWATTKCFVERKPTNASLYIITCITNN